jgi:hypothetical protein
VCTNASSDYQEFSLNSSLIASITSNSQLSEFHKGRDISSTNPIEITGATLARPTITFPSTYQVMEISLRSTRKIRYFFVRTGPTRPVINYTLTSSTDNSYEYLITVPPLVQATDSIFLVISPEETANITAFKIKACTGKISWFDYHPII